MAINSTENTEKSIFQKAVYSLWHFHKKLVISSAVLFSLFIIIITANVFYLESYPERVERFIEVNSGIKVTFDDINIGINVISPSFLLTNLAIKDETGSKDLLRLQQARITIAAIPSLWHKKLVIKSIYLSGVKTSIKRDINGNIFIGDLLLKNQKVKKSAPASEDISSALGVPGFRIMSSEITLLDEYNELPSMSLKNIYFRMRNNNENHQISLSTTIDESQTKLKLKMDFTGPIYDIKQWYGNAYLSINSAESSVIADALEQNLLSNSRIKLIETEIDTKVWGSLKKGEFESIKGTIKLANTRVDDKSTRQSLIIDKLSTDFQINHQPKYWNIDISNLNFTTSSQYSLINRLNVQYDNKEKQKIKIYADIINLEAIMPFADFITSSENTLLLQQLNPRGVLRDSSLALTIDPAAVPTQIYDYRWYTTIEDLELNAHAKIPGINHLNATVWADSNSGYVSFTGKDQQIFVKHLFRQPWPVSELAGNITWQRDSKDWLISGNEINVVSPHLNINGDVKLWLPEGFPESGSPFMDINAYFSNADLRNAPLYYPVAIMSDKLVSWLDKNIISGMGTDGGVLYRGRLNQFPYNDHTGQLDIVFNADDVVMDYMPGWPRLENIDAIIQFTGQGMWADASQVKVFDSISKNAVVELDSYKKSLLTINGDVKTNVKDSVKFLQQSKLLDKSEMGMLDAAGNLDLNLDLLIPLAKKGVKKNLITIQLLENDYFPIGIARRKGIVSNLNGIIKVYNTNLYASDIKARIMGYPALINIIKDANEALNEVTIDTRIDFDKLLKYELLSKKSKNVFAAITGSSKAKIAINFPVDKSKFDVNVTSDLKGTESILPWPFAKDAAQNMEINTFFSQDFHSRRIRFKASYGNKLGLSLLLADTNEDKQILKGHINFGGAVSYLPEKDRFLISGAINDIDPAAWLELLNNSLISTAPSVEKTNMDSDLPVFIALSEFNIPAILFNGSLPAEGTTTHIRKKPNSTKASVFEPGSFPVVNGAINKLKYDGTELGHFSISSGRIENGIFFENINLTSANLSVKGYGHWHQWNQQPEFELEGNIEVKSLEKLFGSIRDERVIEDGQLKLSGNIGWKGDYADYTSETMDADFSFTIKDGRFAEIKQGTIGRAFGLLNMQELSKRISLDFSDVSKKGLEFNTIQGDFRITRGKVYSNNLWINAPSANIFFNGSSEIDSEKIDLTITIIPEVSGTLPLAGAAVAGPAGAAVGWIGGMLFSRQINKLTAFSYEVTGTWSQPILKRTQASAASLKKIGKIINPVQEQNLDESIKDLQ